MRAGPDSYYVVQDQSNSHVSIANTLICIDVFASRQSPTTVEQQGNPLPPSQCLNDCRKRFKKNLWDMIFMDMLGEDQNEAFSARRVCRWFQEHFDSNTVAGGSLARLL